MSKTQISFWKLFWPSFVAIIIASLFSMIFFFLFLGATIGALTADFEPKKFKVADNSILHLKLDQPISDRSTASFNPMEFKVDGSIGLVDILYGLEEAKTDTKIKGVFIDLNDLQCGMATLFEIRKAIEDFKQSSGKFVIAYNSGELISQKEYLLSSVADENYGFPTSTMEFLGLGVEYMFFKNLFSKLSVEMQVVRGENNDFKSAVEPYFLDKMSDSSRVQTERYLNGMWAEYLNAISTSRNISVAELDSIAEHTKIRRASDAVDYKLLDAILYQDEIYALLKKKVNKANADKLSLVNFEQYARRKFKESKTLDGAKDANIAVVLAQGAIDTNGDGIASNSLVKQLREAREDKNIKAIVFRVNSPGGSALASEEIWREVSLANEVKTVVVSMGDVAASGGYYISAPAKRIFAEPTTITGSIGVFGVIPYTGKMLEEKLGLTFDRASTNTHSVMTTNRKLTDKEFAVIQSEVNKIYTEFVDVVAKGRSLTPERVNQIARGRVWTGVDALEIGLVDELGGLNEAIQYAIKDANIEKPTFIYYPKTKKDGLMEILEMIAEQQEDEASASETLTGEAFKLMQQLKELDQIRGVQMRMPYYFEIR